jgi:hypothetical protein
MTHARAAISLALLASTACASVRPVHDPARFVTDTRPAVVYIVHANRALITVAGPHVRGDTLHGTWADQPGRTVAVPMQQVQSMVARQPDGKRSALLLAGVGTLAAVAVFAVVTQSSGEPLECSYHTWPPPCRTN